MSKHLLPSQSCSIFALLDPRDHEVRHVSIAASPLRARLLFLAYCRSCPELGRWLLSLKALNLFPEIKIIATGSDEEMVDVEPLWRRTISRHHNLLGH